MPEGSGPTVLTPRHTTAAVVGCIYHKKDARFEIRWYEREHLVVIWCRSCNPPSEVCKFHLAKE